MKIAKKIMLFTVVFSTLLACKKGENDPFLSLRTRKARVTGEWKVSNISATNTSSSSSGTTTYDGTNYTQTNTYNGNTSTFSNLQTEEYTFEKDGTFKRITIITEGSDSYTETYTGNWSFVGKNKSSDVKKKEAILLSYTSYLDSDGESITLDGTFVSYETLMIDQLKNDEIIITLDESSTESNGFSPSYTYTKTGTMTLTKK